MFASPEILLSPVFHSEVLRHNHFWRNLIAVAIDEVDLVKDWSDFRPRFGELHVLRARLPQVPFLGVSATLDKEAIAVIRKDASFGDCELIRTSIDRPEICINIIFMEGNVSCFEDLRRFFPLDMSDPYQVPKTIFYFDSKNEIRNFIERVTNHWFPEWGFPPGARKSIQPLFTDMAEYDKSRIANMFERPDNRIEPHLGSSIRFLATSEAYGLGAHNPDVRVVVNWKVPKSKNSLPQRMGRAARDLVVEGGQYYLVVPRWACERVVLRKNLVSRQIQNTNTAAHFSNQTSASESDGSNWETGQQQTGTT